MRGYIKQRAKGSWTIWIDAGRDPSTGKRRCQTLTVGGTKRNAEAKLAELQHQINTGGFVKLAKLTANYGALGGGLAEALVLRWPASDGFRRRASQPDQRPLMSLCSPGISH